MAAHLRQTATRGLEGSPHPVVERLIKAGDGENSSLLRQDVLKNKDGTTRTSANNEIEFE